ncbi:MAG TPA: SDR family oxidoreductase [Terriglobia bacterium]|nr:SDR family oxidoreductase [Terriglobia bacterium]
MHPRIENKVAVVTGASRGIGYRIAERLLEEGAKVMICSLHQHSLEEALSALRKKAGQCVEGMKTDVRDYRQVEAFMAACERSFGGIDILVNNAGIGIFRSVERLTPEEWDAVIATNLSGPFYCVRAAAPRLKRRGGGYIFNISSLAGKNAFAGGAAYNASKFGLNGFSEAMMLDLRYENIRTTYIMPGSVDTAFAGAAGAASWKISPDDVAQIVIDLLKSDPRSMQSRVEIRPSQPPRR